MALALYRTYRPGTLAEVVGQEHVTEALARALASGRTHHAYLLSGPRGCGKTSTARILARSMNCEQGPTPTPCGQCRSCLDLAPNGPGSIDVVEMDAATHRGVDDARDLREKAIYAPAASRYRVYIIDEAHQLTNEAANALLKLIEEPPAHLRFIFATTEPDKIIPTIRSRTFHYPFRLVPARTLVSHLANVCAAEGTPAEPAALAVVARAGAGSVRDSLSVLGQLLAAAGPEGLTHLDAVQALGLTDESLIDGFVAALSAGSVAAMLGVVEGVISGGHDPRRFVSDVLDRLRDLIVLRADPAAVESGLIDVPDEAGRRLLGQAESLGLAELSRAADLVSTGLSEVKGATAPRLQLELLCARLALHGPGEDLTSVLVRLERLERTLAAGASPVASGDVYGGSAGPPRAPSVPASDLPAPVAVSQSGPGGGAGTAAADPGSSRPTSGATAQDGPNGGPPSDASPDASRGLSHAGGERTGSAPSPPRRPTLTSGRAMETPSKSGTPKVATTDSAAESGPDKRRAAASASGAAGAAAPAGRPEAGPDADPASTPVEQRPGAATESGVDRNPELAQVTAAWPSVLDRLAQGSRVAWTAFAGARPLSLSQGTLAVAVVEPGKAAAITQRGHDLRLREALLAVLDLDVTIDVVFEGGAGDRGAAEAGAPPVRASGSVRPGSDRSGSDRPSARRRPAASASDSAGQPHAAAPSIANGPTSGASAAAGRPDAVDEPDVPSDDDPDADDVDGLELVARELGARTISEIDHT